jgi:hypothetical protein
MIRCQLHQNPDLPKKKTHGHPLNPNTDPQPEKDPVAKSKSTGKITQTHQLKKPREANRVRGRRPKRVPDIKDHTLEPLCFGGERKPKKKSTLVRQLS